MGSEFIEKLKKMVEEYPSQRVHKILAFLITAMIKIRHIPSYMLESISAASLAKQYALKAIRNLSSDAQNEFEMKMMDITQSIALFSEFTDEEVGQILQFCSEITPVDNSLELFLGEHFGVNAEPPSLPNFIYSDTLALQSAMLEMVGGFYAERFIMRPAEQISDKDLLQAIVKFYGNQGFSMMDETDFSVAMEKDNELITVAFSNYGSSVHITAENLG